MQFEWDEAKSAKVKAERGLSFREIAEIIARSGVLGIEESAAYPGQFLFAVKAKSDIWTVVVEPRGEKFRLCTAYPNRKWRKKYAV
ncbi:MAG TPA: hypothetical protein VIM58_05330 [Candidatus Methylacidiphilales bacterium]